MKYNMHEAMGKRITAKQTEAGITFYSEDGFVIWDTALVSLEEMKATLFIHATEYGEQASGGS